RRQHLAVSELRDVGCGALAEADHHGVLLAHELGAESGTAAVSPGGPGEWRQPALRRDARHAREYITQLRLLGGELLLRLEMLQGATTANAEVRAARHDARGRGLEHFEQLAVVVLAVAPRAPEANELTGQRPGDEGGLATVNNALSLVGETCHAAQLVAQGAACQACRNSAKCGSVEAAR